GGPPSLGAGVARGWQVARSTLFIPCPGEDGLFGFFEVHAAASGPIESEAAIDRAALAARVLGAAFDRANLRAELTSLHQDQKRGTRLETLGRVASSVAHDFNNVLTAILGYADLLEMEIEDTGKGQSELGEIRQAATRAAKLVDQVLTFGRTRTAGDESVDLAETIECLGGMLRQVLGEGIALDFDWLERAPKVELDRARFGPALMNLASNARGALASQDV
ncbi:MAG: sensor histidine kinase, partial [bacterium]